MRANELWAFARERELVRLRRATGAPPPWTDDPILRTYRFCNIYREHDRVTRWLAENWREPHHDDPDLWFAFVVARHLNSIPTLRWLGDPPVVWNPPEFLARIDAWRDRGMRVFGPAYMISTHGRVAADKVRFLVEYVFTPLWARREGLRPRAGDTLNAYHMLLGQMSGLGSFLAAQVVADVKYVEPLRSASDWETFAASGPGSRRGLNRVLGRPVARGWIEDDWRLSLADVAAALRPQFEAEGWPVPHAQDVQNIFCEYDKYERTRLGEGKPKQIYRPAHS
jgi:hypothetical protein